MHGLLPMGSISFDWDLVNGSMRVPNPAAGITAFFIKYVTLFHKKAYVHSVHPEFIAIDPFAQVKRCSKIGTNQQT
jgi:hypothetical protein